MGNTNIMFPYVLVRFKHRCKMSGVILKCTKMHLIERKKTTTKNKKKKKNNNNNNDKKKQQQKKKTNKKKNNNKKTKKLPVKFLMNKQICFI